jgi:hypothetical protein
MGGGGVSVTVLPKLLEWQPLFYCRMVCSYVPIFNLTPLPVPGSFTATIWIQTVATYTTDPK